MSVFLIEEFPGLQQQMPETQLIALESNARSKFTSFRSIAEGHQWIWPISDGHLSMLEGSPVRMPAMLAKADAQNCINLRLMKLLGPYYYLENMTDNDYSAII